MSDDTYSNTCSKGCENASDDRDSQTFSDPREDARMCTSDSIATILAYYNQWMDVDENATEYDYMYHMLSEEGDYPFDGEIEKPVIGCLFCHQEITLKSGCYMFCQIHEHYDRDVLLVACSDICPKALQYQSVSKCHKCARDYVHDRYDGDICRECNTRS